MQCANAGFWKRVTALTLDEIVLFIVTWLLLVIMGYTTKMEMIHRLVVQISLYEVLDYNYYTLCWYFFGQTVGKRFMKIKVVKIDGQSLTYKDVFVRYWTWMIGIAVFGIGYFWISWDKNKRGWNDHAAKTIVIFTLSACAKRPRPY